MLITIAIFCMYDKNTCRIYEFLLSVPEKECRYSECIDTPLWTNNYFFSPKRPPLFFMVLEDTVTIKFTFTFYDHSCAINGRVGGAGLK